MQAEHGAAPNAEKAAITERMVAMKQKMLAAGVALLLTLGLAACSPGEFLSWVGRAKAVLAENRQRSYARFELDAQNPAALTAEDGRVYHISDEEANDARLGEVVGAVTLNGAAGAQLVVDADTGRVLPEGALRAVEVVLGELSAQRRVVVRYGNVYALEGGDAEECVAVEVNGTYYVAAVE